MGFFKGIIDFALFKEFVTPGFLKMLYLVIFLILNLGGIIGIGAVTVMGVLGALAMKNNMGGMVVSILVALLMALVGFAFLVLYNLFFRMYFELALILFNIHGYLKSIDDKTSKR